MRVFRREEESFGLEKESVGNEAKVSTELKEVSKGLGEALKKKEGSCVGFEKSGVAVEGQPEPQKLFPWKFHHWNTFKLGGFARFPPLFQLVDSILGSFTDSVSCARVNVRAGKGFLETAYCGLVPSTCLQCAKLFALTVAIYIVMASV
ncbi:hypothetical protein COLO4_16315 [Corchorus olitorius]|uniref:Uncharacterized protein n=1 Tax=Corchorus olitorius TaxID=93759 RepID=A0A1R3JHY9_9ROSI|nr:hypothetical protein COLO4_16315 [Corchorus olitorius]